VQRGARVHALCRAERIAFASGRAVGVHATRRPQGEALLFRAQRGVILAAGALHTPLLLWRSGLRRNVGEGYQAHPGAAVLGRFDHQVGMGAGATQAYEVPLREQRLKLESIALPPELLAARLPGAGAQWQRDLRKLDYFAQFCTIVRMRARGRVRPSLFGGVAVRFEPLPEDVVRLKHGVALLVRMMFAAGAVEVLPGVHGVPERITRVEDAQLILADHVRRRDVHLMASHHFGTAAANADPRYGVVDAALRCHDAEGLYVMDASALPTNLGVNPQHSIMALAWRAAERLANAARPRLRSLPAPASAPASL
jgi:choline dehydrogenase-like flavoprotein